MTTPATGIGRLLPGIAQQAGRQQASEVQPEGNFADLFANLVESVNELHQESAQIQQAFLSGEPVELHRVMIKAEEAGLATELLLEIRNRVVNAYNELLRMPV